MSALQMRKFPTNHFKKLLLFFFLVLLQLLATVLGKCPAGWYKDDLTMKCLYYIPTQATFDDAQTSCRHIGGGLVAPTSQLDIPGVSYYM